MLNIFTNNSFKGKKVLVTGGFLSSDLNTYISGHDLVVDGGFINV